MKDQNLLLVVHVMVMWHNAADIIRSYSIGHKYILPAVFARTSETVQIIRLAYFCLNGLISQTKQPYTLEILAIAFSVYSVS